MRTDNKTTASEVPTAILLPGLLCDEAVWGGQLEPLSRQLGCIVADYAELDSLPAMAQRVLAQAPSRLVLIAHSMGGRVALEIMRVAPSQVSALALLDTGYQGAAAGPAGDTEARQRHALLQIAISQGMRAMGTVWLRGMVESILAMIERSSPEIFAAQIRALLARPDATDVLTAIRCPTLVICGRQDAWSPLARHQEMAGLIQGAQLTVIEDCGHMSPMEQPAEVTARLSEWLALRLGALSQQHRPRA
jgi:pimeloyl-ACP methyl ester carboxylesterase